MKWLGWLAYGVGVLGVAGCDLELVDSDFVADEGLRADIQLHQLNPGNLSDGWLSNLELAGAVYLAEGPQAAQSALWNMQVSAGDRTHRIAFFQNHEVVPPAAATLNWGAKISDANIASLRAREGTVPASQQPTWLVFTMWESDSYTIDSARTTSDEAIVEFAVPLDELASQPRTRPGAEYVGPTEPPGGHKYKLAFVDTAINAQYQGSNATITGELIVYPSATAQPGTPAQPLPPTPGQPQPAPQGQQVPPSTQPPPRSPLPNPHPSPTTPAPQPQGSKPGQPNQRQTDPKAPKMGNSSGGCNAGGSSELAVCGGALLLGFAFASRRRRRD